MYPRSAPQRARSAIRSQIRVLSSAIIHRSSNLNPFRSSIIIRRRLSLRFRIAIIHSSSSFAALSHCDHSFIIVAHHGPCSSAMLCPCAHHAAVCHAALCSRPMCAAVLDAGIRALISSQISVKRIALGTLHSVPFAIELRYLISRESPAKPMEVIVSKRMSKDRHSIYVSRRVSERERSIARKRERADKWFATRAEYLAMGGVR